MNDIQFKCWRNSSIASGIISKEEVDNIQLTFSPEDIWGSYHLVLVNSRETDVNVHIRLVQKFFVRVLDYRNAFEWFKIAFLAIIVLLMLPLPLGLAIDNLMFQIRRRLLSKYGVYTPKRPIPVFQIVLIISIIFFLVHSCSLLPSLTHFTFVANIWEDYLYRLAISDTLLAIIFVIILSLSLNVLHFLEMLLMRKCYADPDTHRKFDKIMYNTGMLLLKRPKNIIFLVICILFLMMLNGLLPPFLNFCSELSPLICLCLVPSFASVYGGYIISLAYFKTEQKIETKTEIDFKYIKAFLSTGILVSATFIIMWRASFPLLNLILQHTLDQNVLVLRCIRDGVLTSKHMLSLCTENEIFTCEHLLSLINDLTVTFAFIVPVTFSLVRYSFIFLSILYLNKKEEFINIPLPANALNESVLDLVFFFIVFGLNLWLQSLISSFDFQKVAWSLASSFAAASFREYLEVIRSD